MRENFQRVNIPTFKLENCIPVSIALIPLSVSSTPGVNKMKIALRAYLGPNHFLKIDRLRF
jgi:hypothetical protein